MYWKDALYIYTYICIYVYMYICIYVYMYICVYVYMYICIYVYMYICVYYWCGQIQTNVCIWLNAPSQLHILTHVPINLIRYCKVHVHLYGQRQVDVYTLT